MGFDSQVVILTTGFFNEYLPENYPEMMAKPGRPYHCLILETRYNFFICLPYRSNIRHKYAFHFKGTKRSRYSMSGLDYTKMLIIQNETYMSNKNVLVDKDEYRETVRHLDYITEQAIAYLEDYMTYKFQSTSRLSSDEYERRYGFSTLPYFDDILNSQKQS